MTDLEIAELFHDAYERLAPEYGYIKRKDTRKFDPNSNNGRLIIEVCRIVVDTVLFKLDDNEVICDGCGKLIGEFELKLPVVFNTGDRGALMYVESLTYFIHNNSKSCLKKLKKGMLNGALKRYLP